MEDTVLFLCKKIYSYLNNKRVHNTSGYYPKAIKNWDKVIQKEDWPYIEKFAHLILNNPDAHISYQTFIDAISTFTGNKWIDAKLLSSPKGLAIYKSYLKENQSSLDPDRIKRILIANTKFVIRQCKDKGYKEFWDYFYSNKDLYPTILEHLENGSISEQFLTLIPNIEKRLYAFPPDVFHDYFKDRVEVIPLNRSLLIKRSEWIAAFAENFERIFEEKLS